MTQPATADEVAAIARMIAAAGLVEGFGHVSARDGVDAFLITSTAPLAGQSASDILRCRISDAAVLDGDAGRRPLEAPLHAAVYRVRRDTGAIVRTHSPHAAAWAARGEVPPLVHGLGGLAGEVVAGSDSDLIGDERGALRAVAEFGDADCILLRANGALCAGPDLAGATVRASYLEERAAIADLAPGALELAGAELETRSRHFDAERARAWQHLLHTYNNDPTTWRHR